MAPGTYTFHTVALTCIWAAACSSLLRKCAVPALLLLSISCRSIFTSSHVQPIYRSIQHIMTIYINKVYQHKHNDNLRTSTKYREKKSWQLLQFYTEISDVNDKNIHHRRIIFILKQHDIHYYPNHATSIVPVPSSSSAGPSGWTDSWSSHPPPRSGAAPQMWPALGPRCTGGRSCRRRYIRKNET